MKTIVIGIVCVLASGVAASAGTPEGGNLFVAKCATCHGASGEGKATIAKIYGVTMRPLGSADVQAKSDADLKKIVTTGGGKMKAPAGLSDKDVSDVVAFVRTLK